MKLAEDDTLYLVSDEKWALFNRCTVKLDPVEAELLHGLLSCGDGYLSKRMLGTSHVGAISGLNSKLRSIGIERGIQVVPFAGLRLSCDGMVL